MITPPDILLLSAATLVSALLIERLRRQRHRLAANAEAMQLERQISAALVRVGRELIRSLDTPAVLERLCQLTTKILACDCSYTFIWIAERDAYVPRCAYGETPEQRAVMALLECPRAAIADLLARLQKQDVVQVAGPRPPEASAALPMQYGNAATLYMALRQGHEIIGIHTAAYRGREERFAAHQERIAEGIAHIATLALANANLLEALARTNRAQSELAARMVHDLRTPLSIITGYNDLLLDGAFGELTSEQAEVLRRISQSAQEVLEKIQATRDSTWVEVPVHREVEKLHLH